jgi:hypothetical protein
MSKRRPLTAKEMGQKRWAGVSKAARKAHAKLMVAARREKRKADANG